MSRKISIKLFLIVLGGTMISYGANIEKKGVQWGFGGSIHIEPSYFSKTLDYFSAPGAFDFSTFIVTPMLRIPRKEYNKFTIEPEIGILRLINKNEMKDSDFLEKLTIGIYSINIYLTAPQSFKSYALYPGLKIGMKYIESKIEYSGENSSNDYDIDIDRNYLVGLVYGGEYLFNPNFSIGGEAQLNYIIINYNQENAYWKWNTSLISTSANFIFRWYIN